MERHEPKMLFCQRCDNLLYPITDADNQMRWLCRACMGQEEHTEISLVYSLQMRKEVSDTKKLSELAMFAQDPTVPITNNKPCPKCQRQRVAWFVNPLEKPVEDMSLYFACTSCNHVWTGDKRSKKADRKGGQTQTA